MCGFEAYIGEKHIIGELKKKEEARRVYRQAVAAGHGAYLMEQEEPVSRPEVFLDSTFRHSTNCTYNVCIIQITQLQFGLISDIYVPLTDKSSFDRICSPSLLETYLLERLQSTSRLST